jgi:hypothetical protein
MSRGIRKKQKIIRSVFVVRADEYRHELLQELLTGCMIREQCVPIHEIQIALIRMRASRLQLIDFLGCLETQEVIEPLLNGVIVSVSDRLV